MEWKVEAGVRGIAPIAGEQQFSVMALACNGVLNYNIETDELRVVFYFEGSVPGCSALETGCGKLRSALAAGGAYDADIYDFHIRKFYGERAGQ